MKMNFIRKIKVTESGFTLVEMLVSTVVSLIVLAGLFQFFQVMTKSFNENRQMAEMQQEVRYALNFVSDSVKLAGNGIPTVSGWSVITNKDGGAGSDSVGVLGCYKSIVVETTQAMANDTSQIKVSSTQGIESGDLVVISYPPNGWQEIFRCTNIAGNLLYHDTFQPYNTDNKLDHIYPLGSIVSVATHYGFFIQEDENGHPNLMVRTQMYNPEILAGDIESFQLRFKMKDNTWVNETDQLGDVRMVEVSIVARTPDPINGFTDPVYNDSYKRVELKTVVIPKNIILVYK
jgi:prepilin-type N-terminal cleavage/methylation domain-containing protein